MFLIKIIENKVNNKIEINIDGDFTTHHKKQFDNFKSDYEIEYLGLPGLKYKDLKSKKDRTCRFCKKSFPDVKFNKVAHLLPQLIGNKKFKSDEECDNCNYLFSKYENDLASFLGITRTLALSVGQEGVPKFKNPDKSLVIQKGDREKKLIEIISEGIENENVIIDEAMKTLTIKAIKASYIRINVYKSLLKIALSLIPLEVLAKYKKSIKFLMTSEFDEKMKGNPFIRMRGYFVPGVPIKKPLVFLWKKSNHSKNMSIPYRTLSIYFQTYILQIFINLDENDRHLYSNKSALFKFLPPFMDKAWIEAFGEPGYFDLDMSDYKLKKGEEQNITMTFDEVNFDV